jgi:hypothetical protein
MAFPTTELFGLGYPANGFFIFGGHFFRQFKSILHELPGSVAGVYKWLLTPSRWPFWCFWVSSNQEAAEKKKKKSGIGNKRVVYSFPELQGGFVATFSRETRNALALAMATGNWQISKI